MPRILVIEDEPKLLRNLKEGLSEEGFDVLTAADGSTGLDLAMNEDVDLLILDLMLPKVSGFEVLAELRRTGWTAPVLILTARDQVPDRIHGLDSGADDYLVKPFAFLELVARVRALLRRATDIEPWILRIADLSLNQRTRSATRGGRELLLSAREYELLEYFLHHVGEVLTREAISQDVWRDPGPVQTNVIDVYVNYLRKKVDRKGERHLIHTVRGVGYCLRAEP